MKFPCYNIITFVLAYYKLIVFSYYENEGIVGCSMFNVKWTLFQLHS